MPNPGRWPFCDTQGRQPRIHNYFVYWILPMRASYFLPSMKESFMSRAGNQKLLLEPFDP